MEKFVVALLAAALLTLTAGCGGKPMPADEHGTRQRARNSAKGPHGGRLLEDGDFALEVTMFERGVPPEFHVCPSRKGQAGECLLKYSWTWS